MGIELHEGVIYEVAPEVEPLSRQPIGIMGVAAGVFLGQLALAILASRLYFLLTH
jgi:hypothetical protein